ncbi:helix-turn-helix transcriptional regulator [Xanthomonas sp. NCPPB 2632]|uniref:helix-turn-helix transcriptional regulator n=1 Tax=Xanthomonas sp. NCPPB 2632 TaxID=3240912 RepID=UPI0035187185
MTNNLGRALKLVRSFHDITQAQAAESLGISRSYLSELEAGHKTPSLDLLEGFSKQFEIPVSSLLIVSESFDNKSLAGRVKKSAADKALKFLEWIDVKRAA